MRTCPLLTIAIPTWNRAALLRLTLEQINREISGLPAGLLEVLVSDNCSSDDTRAVVEQVVESGLPVNYIRNRENIGSDANIAQCFNSAQGEYVHILGDDDLIVDGGLEILMSHLSCNVYGVVCFRPYGFEFDFRKEHPGFGGRERIFNDGGEFLAAIGPYMTLISSCVINRKMLSPLDAQQFCGGALVQVHLVIRAALASGVNLYIDKYMIACMRNNSGGYDFSTVFVTELGKIFDSYCSAGLTKNAVAAIENRLIAGYYPFYLLRQLLTGTGDLPETRKRFAGRFTGRRFYYLWLAPLFWLPRPFAVAWGAVITIVGRSVCGDFRRGLIFAWNRLAVGRRLR